METISHAPADYVCPFCLIAQGASDPRLLTVAPDIVYRDDLLTAFIGSGQWPRNPGHVIVIPNAHFENLFDLPVEYGTPIQRLVRDLAWAMKAEYGCAGISTRQHNEPAGNQDVWHYHLHVFPRYEGDRLYQSDRAQMPPAVRATYAARLRNHLQPRAI